MSKKYIPLALALVAGLASANAASAQWEEVYGDQNRSDEGHRRVTPVTQCLGRGYVAIGTRDIGGTGGGSYVTVVRTDNGGATLWEGIYDVGHDGLPDEGFSLVELKDGTGFVTTGTSFDGSQWHAHAMKLNCDGKVLRSNFYVIPGFGGYYRLVGHDIREAHSGDGVTTNGGDLLIAGYVDDISWQSDAALLRLDAGLNLIWHRRYDTGVNERFYGLTETKPTYAATGDIAAVGTYGTLWGVDQALVARVDGLDGLMGFSPDHCMASYGDGGYEDFQSIVEVQTWPDSGALTMAGRSSSPGLNDDVYLVQTKSNPCSMRAQVTLGNETGDPFSERATDLIEILHPVNPVLGVPVGSFALTGAVETKYSPSDAFLLFVKPTSLHPITARRYGDHRSSVDFGTSLQQNDPNGPQSAGFILAGTTYTDWDGGADPGDLYLIQTNDGAKTGCELGWRPDGLDQPWHPDPLYPHIDKFVRQVRVPVKYGFEDTVFQVCF